MAKAKNNSLNWNTRFNKAVRVSQLEAKKILLDFFHKIYELPDHITEWIDQHPLKSMWGLVEVMFLTGIYVMSGLSESPKLSANEFGLASTISLAIALFISCASLFLTLIPTTLISWRIRNYQKYKKMRSNVSVWYWSQFDVDNVTDIWQAIFKESDGFPKNIFNEDGDKVDYVIKEIKNRVTAEQAKKYLLRLKTKSEGFDWAPSTAQALYSIGIIGLLTSIGHSLADYFEQFGVYEWFTYLMVALTDFLLVSMLYHFLQGLVTRNRRYQLLLVALEERSKES